MFGLAGQVEQHRESGGPFDQGAECGAATSADEGALPVSRTRSVLDLGGPLTDQDLGSDNAWPRPRRRALGTRSACPVRRQAVSSRRRAPRPWMDSAWETASCEILIETSSGYALRRRWAICCGLHDVAPCRSRRRPGRRPVQALTFGPGTGLPSSALTVPARRSCTERRRRSVVASLALFGRLARRGLCHGAVDARYARPPRRVAALRHRSRETVDGALRT